MSVWRKDGRICGDNCYRQCRCSRWPDYKNRFGWPVSGQTYDDKVLATGPIAYWPQSETAGPTAHCLVNPLQDGTYTGVTLADDNTGPFGTPAPWYDGAADYCNIHSAALAAGFNGATGSAMIWYKIFDNATWADGSVRRALQLEANGNNLITVGYKPGAGNLYDFYLAGGVNDNYTWAETRLTWIQLLMTWNQPADEVRYYLDGAWMATDVGLGIWVGVLFANTTVIGAGTTAPGQPHKGWLGPCALWDRPLIAPEVAGLYVT